VAEVTTLEYPRITINGWFHESNYKSEGSKLQPSTSVQVKFSPESTVDLSEWITDSYLKDVVQRKIQQQIEENSEISLNQFLAPEVFDVMANEFKTNRSLKWQLAGPANLRKYEYLKIDDAGLRGPIKDLLTLFTSKEMFELLHAYTELDLGGENVREPKCFVEIQRWQSGCYTVLSDSSNDSAESALDLILYFNAVDSVGTITYLSPEGTAEDDEGDGSDVEEEEEEEKEPVNLTIEPKNNELNVVFRSEGTTKFTKYVSKKCLLNPSEYSYLMVCSYKE
jgi:prolyl 3-hydroxylase /prolyl 3,4-dihydroxylase